MMIQNTLLSLIIDHLEIDTMPLKFLPSWRLAKKETVASQRDSLTVTITLTICGDDQLPSSILTKTDSPERFPVEFTFGPDKCISCEVCVRVCPD